MNTETNNITATNGSPAGFFLKPPTPRRHRPHRSKISELPIDVRDFVNESIHNHVPRKKIIESLAQKGHPGINLVNITKWTKSGYQLWLQERERFQCLRLKMDESDKYFRHLDADGLNRANYVNGRLIDLHMAQVMRDFDPSVLRDRVQFDPTEFFKFVRATHFRSLDRQRDDRLKLLREKIHGTDVDGPTKSSPQAIKASLKLRDSWIAAPTETINPN